MWAFRENGILPVRVKAPNGRPVAEIARIDEREQSDEPGARRATTRLRDSELFLLALALGAGVAAGLGVVAIDLLRDLLRLLAFALPAGEHLSSAKNLAPMRVLLTLVAMGLFSGPV